jgi:HEAT repeat protein
MKSFILAAALLASTASMAARIQPKPLPVQAGEPKPDPEMSDEDVRSQMAAYLGAIDTPIPLSSWKSLGLRAESPLLAIVQSDALPTRRAKAIDGLAAIGTSHIDELRSIADNDGEVYVVRLAAIRGLGNLLSENEMVSALTPLLTSAKDARIRSVAGLVMVSHSAATCPAVKAQIRSESTETRGHFVRAMDACFAK